MPTSLWDRIRWFLFGETNIICTLSIVGVIIFWSVVIFVMHHFIAKYW